VLGGATARVAEHDDASPLGPTVFVPYLDHGVRVGTWVAALIELSGGDPPADPSPCRVAVDGAEVHVDWPDGESTRTPIPPDKGVSG
jgi:hypothetical protein